MYVLMIRVYPSMCFVVAVVDDDLRFFSLSGRVNIRICVCLSYISNGRVYTCGCLDEYSWLNSKPVKG